MANQEQPDQQEPITAEQPTETVVEEKLEESADSQRQEGVATETATISQPEPTTTPKQAVISKTLQVQPKAVEVKTVAEAVNKAVAEQGEHPISKSFFTAVDNFMKATAINIPFESDFVRREEEELARNLRSAMRNIPEEEFAAFWKKVVVTFNSKENEPLAMHRIHRAGNFWKESETLARFFTNIVGIIHATDNGIAQAKKRVNLDKSLEGVEEVIRNKIIQIYS